MLNFCPLCVAEVYQNDNPILLIRHLLFTACATFGINSPKQYHKSYKYSSFDDPLCEKCTKVAQGVIK